MTVRTVFMGSDEFSLPSLRALMSAAESPHDARVALAGVVTAPDRPRGRGRRMSMSPVKEIALAAGLPILQPVRLRDPAAVDEVLALRAELLVVASYGQIVPRKILEAPPHGSLNIHPSLLPLYRGPSPVQGAILAGETVTGVTLMLMNPRMDEGPILAQHSALIAPGETAGELEARLAVAGAELLIANLGPWLQREIEPQPQDSERATYTRLLRKEDGLIDWTAPASELERRVRAFNPWPVAFTFWKGRALRLLRARVAAGDGTPGAVLAVTDEGALVGTGEGLLLVQQLQLEGARPLPAAAFGRGQRSFAGSVLG